MSMRLSRPFINTPHYSIHWRTKGTSVVIVPKRLITIFIVNDIHIPFYDPNALNLTVQLINAVRPDIIILNGDINDFFAISRFTTAPWRKLMLAEEINEVVKTLNWLFDETRHVHCQWIYLAGNHEERLRMFLWRKAPELAGLEALSVPQLFKLPDNVIYLDYKHTPQRIEDDIEPCVEILDTLIILHGAKLRLTGNAINLALTIFRKTLMNTIVGHWHRSDQYIQPNFRGVSRGVWVVPCLSLPRPHWDSGRIWGQGCCVVTVNERGFFNVELLNYIRTDGKLLAFWGGNEYTVRANLVNKWSVEVVEGAQKGKSRNHLQIQNR